jgi:hypothetical protein
MASTGTTTDGGLALPDIYTDEILSALALPGCPLCRVVDGDDRRLLDAFRREGRRDPRARGRFLAAGGLCRRHGWLLHELAAAAGEGGSISDLYGSLADSDLVTLDETIGRLRRRARGRAGAGLRREGRCQACDAREAAAERKTHFLLQALREAPVRERYGRSDGLCYPHLENAVAAASTAGDPATAVALLEDWRARLAAVRSDLAAYDRKRMHEHADEPKGREQRSWTEVIRRYVGEDGTDAP